MFGILEANKTLCLAAVAVAMSVGVFLPVCADAVETDDPPMLRGLGIPTYLWRNDKGDRPQAIVVGFHSGCSHGKSFDALARQLAGRDVMFVSFDMRGYGKWYHDSYGTEADRTFDYTRTVDDIKRLLGAVHKEFPGTPVYCLGESLGANMAMVVAHDMPKELNGVILVSPYFVARKWLSPRFLADAAHIMTHPKGEVNLSPYFKKKLAYSDTIGEQQVNDPESRTKQTLAEIHRSITLDWSGRKKIRSINPNLPVLILHGKQDELCNPSGTASAFEHIPSTKKKLVLVEGLGHIAAESSEISPAFFAALTSWIDTQDKLLSTASVER